MMRYMFPLLLLLGGCVDMQDWPKKGLTPEILLQLEQTHWGTDLGQISWADEARFRGVPVEARAIALRDVKCRRQGVDSGLYDCSYLVDYGRGGKIEGTYQRTDATVGKDEHGIWVDGWIVVT